MKHRTFSPFPRDSLFRGENECSSIPVFFDWKTRKPGATQRTKHFGWPWQTAIIFAQCLWRWKPPSKLLIIPTSPKSSVSVRAFVCNCVWFISPAWHQVRDPWSLRLLHLSQQIQWLGIDSWLSMATLKMFFWPFKKTMNAVLTWSCITT